MANKKDCYVAMQKMVADGVLDMDVMLTALCNFFNSDELTDFVEFLEDEV